jgi:hypothetical protein
MAEIVGFNTEPKPRRATLEMVVKDLFPRGGTWSRQRSGPGCVR